MGIISMREKVESGKYQNVSEYPDVRTSNLSPSQFNKARREYVQECNRLTCLFYRDCCEDLELDPEKSSSLAVYQRACDAVTPYDELEVYKYMADLIGFVRHYNGLVIGND